TAPALSPVRRARTTTGPAEERTYPASRGSSYVSHSMTTVLPAAAYGTSVLSWAAPSIVMRTLPVALLSTVIWYVAPRHLRVSVKLGIAAPMQGLIRSPESS